MQGTTEVHDTWLEWLEAHDGDEAPDEATKVAALRDYILQEAREAAADDSARLPWVNKKLPQLGITEQIPGPGVAYGLQVPVTGTLDMIVYAQSRTEALEKASALLDGTHGNQVRRITPTAAPTFTSGPEDPDPQATDDTPTTVDALLTKFREIIMLGVIAGPHLCTSGSNAVLAKFGLDPIPGRQTFTVGMPVDGVMKTMVEAYDAESAKRVAGWRWDNSRTGYSLDTVTDTGPLVVVAPNS